MRSGASWPGLGRITAGGWHPPLAGFVFFLSPSRACHSVAKRETRMSECGPVCWCYGCCSQGAVGGKCRSETPGDSWTRQTAGDRGWRHANRPWAQQHRYSIAGTNTADTPKPEHPRLVHSFIEQTSFTRAQAIRPYPPVPIGDQAPQKHIGQHETLGQYKLSVS